MFITYNRESVCMGDDCMSHKLNRELADNMMVSELLLDLANYVPKMHKVVWAVSSSNVPNRIIGYIITDDQGNDSFSIKEDITLAQLFETNTQDISVFCKYYHSGSFTWRNGDTGEIVEKYKEQKTLFEKVKMACQD